MGALRRAPRPQATGGGVVRSKPEAKDYSTELAESRRGAGGRFLCEGASPPTATTRASTASAVQTSLGSPDIAFPLAFLSHNPPPWNRRLSLHRPLPHVYSVTRTLAPGPAAALHPASSLRSLPHREVTTLSSRFSFISLICRGPGAEPKRVVGHVFPPHIRKS